jgi:hypothetical protein
MKGSKAVLIVLALAGATLVAAAVAGAAPGHKKAASGDPFSACSRAADVFGGAVFPSTEPEVWLAANPAAPKNLIGAIQQDRWDDGGAQGLVAPYSLDDGMSWKEVPLPFSVCASSYYHGKVLKDPFTGRPYDRASDPWVSVGPDGTAYAVSISFDANDNGGAVGAATSRNGGKTWRNQQNITAENATDPSLPFNDKESDTADPVRAGVAYAVWDRLQDIACPPGVPPANATTDERPYRFGSAAGAAPFSVADDASLDCFVGPTMLSRTTDFGRTWSTPIAIVPTAANEQTIGNEIVVDRRTDTLYDFYMYLHADNSLTVEDVASHDGGLTWGPRQIVSDSQSVGVSDPNTGDALRTADIIPQPAIDPHTGRLYVVWQDSRANAVDPNEDALFISSSKAGGLTGTWSAPAVVNDPTDEAAFTPAVKVLGNGAVAVQYYVLDGKGASKPGVLTTGVFLRTTKGRGTTFSGPEMRVGTDFNMLAAPNSGGWFTGDYEGVAVDARDPRILHTFFTATNCKGTGCDAVAGFDQAGNPIPSSAPNPTAVYSNAVHVAKR